MDSPARPHPLVTASFWLAVAAMLALGLRTITGASFWMHLASGRLIADKGIPATEPFSFTTDTARPWINPEWLYDLLLYRCWSALGAAGVILLTAVVVAVSFLFALRSAGTRQRGDVAGWLMLLAVWVIAPAFVPGPAMAGLFLVALSLFVLSRPLPLGWKAGLLVPVQLIWCNLHASFVLAPLLVAVYAVDAGLRKERGTKRGLWMLATCLALVTLANPYGFALHQHLISTASQPGLTALIEWISPFQGEFASHWLRHAGTVLLLLMAAGFVLVKEKLSLPATTFAVLGALMLVVSPYRFAVLGTLLLMPFTVVSTEALFARFGAKAGAGRVPVAAVLLAVAGLTIVVAVGNRYYTRIGSASGFGLHANMDMVPSEACKRVLARPDFPERMINLAMDGGYLAWEMPERKIFCDPRVSVYGAVFYQGLARALLGDEQTWTNLLERWQPEAFLINCTWPGSGAALRRLVDNDRWALAYFDGVSAVVVERTTKHQAMISDFSLRMQGLQVLEAARKEARGGSGGLGRPNPVRLIAASTALTGLLRFREAGAVLEDVMPLSPVYATGWINLGVARLQMRQAEAARDALLRARALRPDVVLNELWLNRAYTALDQPELAARALRSAEKLNKGAAEAFIASFNPTNAPPAAAPGRGAKP